MAQGGEAPFQGGKEPPPPTWDGSEPGLDLANFEKNVKLWEYESELDPKKRGVRLLRSLTGVARSVGDTLEFEEVACEKGVANIMTALKAHFAPHLDLEVSLPRAFERAIYGQPRSHKESMQEYLIRSERNFHLLEKEKLKLPDEAMGYVTYRQAALTENQDLKFTTWSNGKFYYKTVAACLRKLEKVVPEYKSKNSSTFVQDNEMDAEQTVDSDWGDPDLLSDDAGQWVLIEEGDVEQVWDQCPSKKSTVLWWQGRESGLHGLQGIHEGQEEDSNRRVEAENKMWSLWFGWTLGKGVQESSGSTWTCRFEFHFECLGNQPSCCKHDRKPACWYVSAGSTCSLVSSSSVFCSLQCFGVSAEGNYNLGSNSINEEMCVDERPLRGLDVFESLKLGSHRIRPIDCSDVAAFFVGLTTNPTMAVVDTAAQDGLIGSSALARLKEQLSAHGLQVLFGLGGKLKHTALEGLQKC